MYQYAILNHPGHNRVYFEEALRFAVYELVLAMGEATAPQVKRIGGLPYTVFQTEEPLDPKQIDVLTNLSFTYGLYELDEGKMTLKPVPLPERPWQDIGSMLKYPGKTNELFTRLMLNTALYSYGYKPGDPVRLLDPVAGKGTTLLEAAVRGIDAYGIELGEKAVGEACQFFKKYLELGKYKHAMASEKVSGPDKSFRAQRHTFTFAWDKETYKRGTAQTLELVTGNSAHALGIYKKNSFHVLVGDLPYGVKHANITNEKQPSFTRNPTELLKTCMPSWKEVLVKGGVLVLSWNTFLAKRAVLEEILEGNGMTVLKGDRYDHFEHRVDQAILRDIIVGRKL